MHNNMITINGKKMGKSYNNVIKLTELFSGNHPILEQAYHPMVVRFYILQTHYRSTLDFGNEALQASEKALRRLWEAYEILKKLNHSGNADASDKELNEKIQHFCTECAEFMNDDLNTAKVIANLFELAPIINGIKGGQISTDAIDAPTFALLQTTFTTYLEDILGLQPLQAEQAGDKMDKVLQVLIDIRKDAKQRKDFATSDLIRNQLASFGVQLKDEKDGTVSYSID
jgi:cysteinyl-tRNA synthetase